MLMNEKIAVTGANGFIGKMLLSSLSAKGKDIVGLVRDVPDSTGDFPVIPYDLSMDRFPDIPGLGTIVHCAWAFGKGNFTLNMRACQVINEYASRNAIRVVFLSSLSATESSRSEYGRAKELAGRMFLDSGQLVISPGLVTGDGALFSRISSMLTALPIIPLPAGGIQPVQLLTGQDLVSAINKGIEEGITGSYNLASPEALALRELFSEMLHQRNIRRPFVSLPAGLFRFLLLSGKMLGLTGGISAENLDGLLGNRVCQTDEDLAIFGLSPRDPRETLTLDEE